MPKASKAVVRDIFVDFVCTTIVRNETPRAIRKAKHLIDVVIIYRDQRTDLERDEKNKN